MSRPSANSFRWGKPTETAIDFGMVDQKGRKIGALVRIRRVAVVANTSETSGYPSADEHEVGTELLEVQVLASRDGKRFGAFPGAKMVKTMDEAKVEARRRVDGMIKRYAKKLNLLAEGCHAKWVCKDTGSILTLRDSADPDAGPYMVICEAHNTCVGVGTKRDGRSCSGLDFCDDCREAASS